MNLKFLQYIEGDFNIIRRKEQSYGSQTSAQLSRSIWNYLENNGYLNNFEFDLNYYEENFDIYEVLIPADKEFSIVYPYDGMEVIGGDNTKITVQLIQRDNEDKYTVFNNGKLIGSTEGGIIEVLLNKGENEICVFNDCVTVSN